MSIDKPTKEKKEGGYYKFFAALKPLTWPERWDYIWTYYKWTLVIVFIVFILIGPVVTALYNNQIEALYNGALVNVILSDEGEEYITDGWRDQLGGDKKWSEVTLVTSYFQSYEESNDAQSEYNALMTIVLRLLMGDLDYILMDNYSMTYFISEGAFKPLEEVLSGEMLTQFEDQLIYAQNDEGEIFPVAIELTDDDFMRANIEGHEVVYIAFPTSGSNAALNDEFFDYLLAWEN